MTKLIASSFALVLAASGAQAFEITAGEVGLTYGSLTQDSVKANEKARLDGSIEVAIAPDFTVQADIGYADFGATDTEGKSAGLHAIYHSADGYALGAFYAHDDAKGFSEESYGLEYRTQINSFEMEAYAGLLNDGRKEAMVGGIWAQYALNDAAKLGLRYDQAQEASLRLSRTSLTGEYAATETLALTGEIGKAKLGNVDEAFFQIGAKMTFGGKEKATFNDRSLFALVPGL